MELGLYTFAEVPLEGSGADAGERLERLLAHAKLADELGLDVFAVGEHHRPDFAVSAPAVVLAAAAARTRRIRLSSAVTVLGSEDPVRVFQQYATLDLLSRGRAEIMAGRGSFVESFPLFGYDLRDYDTLFAEKLELLLALRDAERVTWEGRHRAPLHDQGVYPRPLQERLPIWIAVGGTPESAARAGHLGLPLALAIIGGLPERFTPFAEIHREAARRAGHARPAFGLNVHGFVAESAAEAIELTYPSVEQMMNRIGRERGWPPTTRASYEAAAGPRGAAFVGDPEQVADKILRMHALFGQERLLVQMTEGAVEPGALARSIELFATEVAPRVRAGLTRQDAEGPSGSSPTPTDGRSATI